MPREVTFISQYRDQTMVMSPATPIYAQNGIKIGEDPGRRIEFKNGRFATSDEAEIEFVRSRILDPAGANCFELDATINAPGINEVLTAIMHASDEELAEMLSAEREQYKRPVVLEALENATLARQAAEYTEEPVEPEPVKRGPGRPRKNPEAQAV